MLGVPELRPLNPAAHQPEDEQQDQGLVRHGGQVGRHQPALGSGIHAAPHDGFNIELDDSTIEQALDYLAVLTKSYLEAAFVQYHFRHQRESQAKRRDYEEQVAKVFYLQNIQHRPGTAGNR